MGNKHPRISENGCAGGMDTSTLRTRFLLCPSDLSSRKLFLFNISKPVHREQTVQVENAVTAQRSQSGPEGRGRIHMLLRILILCHPVLIKQVVYQRLLQQCQQTHPNHRTHTATCHPLRRDRGLQLEATSGLGHESVHQCERFELRWFCLRVAIRRVQVQKSSKAP